MTEQEKFTYALLKQAIEKMENISKEERKSLYHYFTTEYSPESLYTMLVSFMSVNLEELVKLGRMPNNL